MVTWRIWRKESNMMSYDAAEGCSIKCIQVKKVLADEEDVIRRPCMEEGYTLVPVVLDMLRRNSSTGEKVHVLCMRIRLL